MSMVLAASESAMVTEAAGLPWTYVPLMVPPLARKLPACVLMLSVSPPATVTVWAVQIDYLIWSDCTPESVGVESLPAGKLDFVAYGAKSCGCSLSSRWRHSVARRP